MNIQQPAYRTLGAYLGNRREIEALQDQVSAGVTEVKEELSAAYQRIAQLENTLTECQSYFEAAADVVDGSYGQPAPNREMSLLIEIDEVLS